MLALPDTGFRPSVHEHNCDLIIAADWVEGSVLLQKDQVSKSDVADYFEDENVYKKGGHATVTAMEFVDNIWTELELREGWLGSNSPFSTDAHYVRRTKKWKTAAGHAFCLLLTFAQQGHKGSPAGGWIVTGDLFERFSARCLELQGWTVIRTGWASGINTPAFQDIVTKVAAMLSEEVGSTAVVADFERANEEGLDLVGYRPFPDRRRGVPAFLVQCASGENWKTKVATPSIDLWRDFIAFSAVPNRCFCFPVALNEADLRVYCRRSKGVFIDRYRLLHEGGGLARNLPHPLREDVIAWCEPRVIALLAAAK